jgi:hypothetical protein
MPILSPCEHLSVLCLATPGKPNSPDWLHEVKRDGYRMLVIRQNADRTRRYPWIARAEIPAKAFRHSPCAICRCISES